MAERRAQLRSQPDAESALLGVAHIERTGSGIKDEYAVDHARLRVAMKRKRLGLLADDPIARIIEREARPDHGGLLLVARFLYALQDHVAVCLVPVIRVVFVENRLLPEVQAVYVSVAEVQGPLVGLERAGFRITRGSVVLDRESPGDDVAGGRPQRHQIRLGPLGIEIISGEGLPVDIDVDLMLGAFQLNRGTD